ncbi:DUF503 domain-containing protein [Anaerolineae bacterium CFX9]|jgi:uncharacterized protein YlxP (DUF503 family)|nr:DUF503 domain-containing protein [Kamptonema cortianum]MDL1900394.1 DUF503 domain-containing protein [Anaerolineae bacterium CFX9]
MSSTVIGICTLTLEIPGSTSLKDKRSVIQSILRRTRNTFNVSIAEVDALDSRERSVIAFAVVSNDRQHVNSVITKVLSSMDAFAGDALVIDEQIEIL